MQPDSPTDLKVDYEVGLGNLTSEHAAVSTLDCDEFASNLLFWDSSAGV